MRRFFDKYPAYADKVVLSVKGGLQIDIVRHPCSTNIYRLGGLTGRHAPTRLDQSDEAALRADLEKAIEILAPVKKIDLFEVARMSKPVEDVMVRECSVWAHLRGPDN